MIYRRQIKINNMKNLRNLTNAVLALTMAGTMFLSSCKKDDDDAPAKLTEEQIETYSENATEISTQMMSSASSFLAKAVEQGYGDVELPDYGKKKSGLANDYSWSGPDSKGWYTRYYDSYGYKYTEKVRSVKDTVKHVLTIEYSGGDGTYKYETSTQYIKYTKNGKALYKGYTKWDMYSSGYNDISRAEWEMRFNDWNPQTGAGTYQWFWGVSQNSGGETISFHKYLDIQATEKSTNLLHVRVKIYDDKGAEVWDFEYDTTFEPVDMSDL